MTEPTRAGYIAGLRKLADVLERHDEVPLPVQGAHPRNALHFNIWPTAGGDVRAEIARVVRAMPCTFTKSVLEGEMASYMNLDGTLEGLHIQITTFRDSVCERVVVGTETVTETVPDPDALAAVPTVEVTREVEQVEWRCGSLLAPADPPAEPPPSGIAVREMGAYDDPSVQAAIRVVVAQAQAEDDDITWSAS